MPSASHCFPCWHRLEQDTALPTGVAGGLDLPCFLISEYGLHVTPLALAGLHYMPLGFQCFYPIFRKAPRFKFDAVWQILMVETRHPDQALEIDFRLIHIRKN